MFHPYHIVTLSPWPVVAGGGVLVSVVSLINLFVYGGVDLIMFSLVTMVLVVVAW